MSPYWSAGTGPAVSFASPISAVPAKGRSNPSGEIFQTRAVLPLKKMSPCRSTAREVATIATELAGTAPDPSGGCVPRPAIVVTAPCGVTLPIWCWIHSATNRRVTALADVDEGGLHRGQHVLDLAQVSVAHVGLLAGPVHVVLDQHTVLEHRDLSAVLAGADPHGPLDRLAAGQELGLGDDRGPAAAGFPALAAPLLLGLKPGGTLDRPHLVLAVRLADVHDGVGRVVGGQRVGSAFGRTPAALAPAPARAGRT